MYMYCHWMDQQVCWPLYQSTFYVLFRAQLSGPIQTGNQGTWGIHQPQEGDSTNSKVRYKMNDSCNAVIVLLFVCFFFAKVELKFGSLVFYHFRIASQDRIGQAKRDKVSHFLNLLCCGALNYFKQSWNKLREDNIL